MGGLSSGDRAALDALSDAGIALTLVDIGASLEPFRAFRPLLGRATYVGFDPDQREMHTEASESGRRVIVNKAVVAESDRATATFFLTHNPTASSTLRPAADELAPYLHAYRYDVVGEAEVPATTLDQALASAGLDRLDWLKLDTQGTDLRLVESLSEPVFATLMAVDAEPGLDPYYETEDTFGDLHRAMTERGFWLADLDLTRAVRLRRETFDADLGARTKFGRMRYEFALKTSPIAVGPRVPAHPRLARQGRCRPRRLPAPLGLRHVLGQRPVRPRRHRRVPGPARRRRADGAAVRPLGAPQPARRPAWQLAAGREAERPQPQALRHQVVLRGRGGRIPLGAGGDPPVASALVAARVLVIDNYDSFVYNLVQYLGELGADPLVHRHDELTLERDRGARPRRRADLARARAAPRTPACPTTVIARFAGRRPVLGVCLGHQCIGQVYGGDVVRAPQIMHGKTSLIRHDGTGVFAGPARTRSRPPATTRLVVDRGVGARRARGHRLDRRRHGHGPAPPRARRRGRAVPPRVDPHRRRPRPAAELPGPHGHARRLNH